MSVEYTKDNLLNFTSWNVIAHCASCQNRFGSGVALQIKEEFPAAWEADCKAAELKENQLGLFSVAEVAGGKRICNVYAQEFYGTEKRQVDYEAFYVGFQRLRDLLESAHKEGRIYTLGVPKFIASDRAGGSWRIIETMLLDLFENSPIKLVIVEYNKPLGKNSEMLQVDVESFNKNNIK